MESLNHKSASDEKLSVSLSSSDPESSSADEKNLKSWELMAFLVITQMSSMKIFLLVCGEPEVN